MKNLVIQNLNNPEEAIRIMKNVPDAEAATIKEACEAVGMKVFVRDVKIVKTVTAPMAWLEAVVILKGVA